MPFRWRFFVIELFYRKIFISVVHDEGTYDVRSLVIKNRKESIKEVQTFEGEGALTSLQNFLQKKISDSPLHYISLLNSDPRQGAMAGCSHALAEETLSDSKVVCRNKQWLLYSSVREIDSMKKSLSPIGIDYLFSPFSVLEVFFKDKINGGLALYGLVQKGSFSIALFDQGKLEFAHHYNMHRDVGTKNEEEHSAGFILDSEEEGEKISEQSDIDILDDLDIIDDLDIFSDIEDLDSLEEIAEFSEDEPTPEEIRAILPNGDTMKSDIDRFGNDFTRFECIQKTLSNFYGMKECQNRFVETVYLADTYGIGTELKHYLEEELFLNVSIRRINLADEVLALSLEEQD